MTDYAAAPLILVVEDDNNHVLLIRRSFEDTPEEYRLESVGTIAAAKAAIENDSPSLILTDFYLPDGEGSKLLTLAAGSCPVIMMTSHGSEQIAVEAMKIGAQDYIVKSPETFEMLPRTVEQALKVWSLIQSRRQSEEKLLASELRFRNLFDQANEGIIIMTREGVLSDVNQSFAKMHGYTVAELMDMDIRELDVLKEASMQERTKINRRIQAGEVVTFDVEHFHKDGHVFPLSVTSGITELNGEIFFQASHQDITELKQANDKLRQQRDLLALQKEELETTLARVKQLEGIIPICSYCKKIRDDKQSWHQLETYISKHSEAMFSHGACPDCFAEQMKKIETSS